MPPGAVLSDSCTASHRLIVLRRRGVLPPRAPCDPLSDREEAELFSFRRLSRLADVTSLTPTPALRVLARLRPNVPRQSLG